MHTDLVNLENHPVALSLAFACMNNTHACTHTKRNGNHLICVVDTYTFVQLDARQKECFQTTERYRPSLQISNQWLGFQIQVPGVNEDSSDVALNDVNLPFKEILL